MVFEKSPETIKETEQEIQKVITFLKEHGHKSEMCIKNEEYIKAYKEEELIERKLKFLCEFLESEKKAVRKEMKDLKEEIAKDCLRMKCEQIDRKIHDEFSKEGEYFGEE